MRLTNCGLWVVVLSAVTGLSGVRAQAPPPDVAPARDTTLFEFERETARRYGAASNPAVLRMTREQYLRAVEKLHPAFRLTAEERRAAQLYGTWKRRGDWDEVAGRWRRTAAIQSWGFPWKEARMLPWAPMIDQIQQGWGKGALTPAPPDHLPDHYLVASVDFRGERTEDTRTLRPFPPAEALKFSLAVDDKPAFVQAGETREGKFGSRNFQYSEYASDPDDRTDTRGNRRRNRLPREIVKQGTSYTQDCKVVFDLLHPDGTPRVGPEAKSVRLVLREGSNEASVMFDLSQWQPASLRAVR